jgi:predicted aldo/keto reductase-like oxidoreductase
MALVENSIKLGFGLMRLPHVNGGKEIDVEETKVMVDKFIKAGGKYFDTAFVYTGSEEAAKKALVERYPRDSYYLADKLNAGEFCCKNEAEAKQEFLTSLERTGAGYFDFYLLHALGEDNLANYEKYGLWDYVKELKSEGKIKHYGISFHDTAALLDEILTDHPDIEFVQLQINYADWEDKSIQSKKCYDVATKHGKPVIVMEPVKGGTLANPPEPVLKVLRDADPAASPASWAIRFVASLPNVMMVLSGMSNVEQMDDNLSFMKDFEPLTADEEKVIDDARTALNSFDTIKCTACHYCTPGCPVEMHIPEIFAVMNDYKIYGDLASAKDQYGWRPGGPKASACIECGQCENACPQKLPIINLLKEVAATFE